MAKRYNEYNGAKDYNNEQLHKYLNGCLKDVVQEAVAAGIPIQTVVPEVVINTRAKSFWGRCTAVGTTVYRIEVTTKLISTDEFSIKNTLMHEVLHTCRGCMNHSRLWKAYASIVNERYGYKIKRVTSSEEKGLEEPDGEFNEAYGTSDGDTGHRRMPVKYIVQCTGCGKSQGYKRAGKVVTRPQNYRCRCGGRLIVRKL